MRSRGSLYYLMAGLLAFLFASGFLGFCVGPDYKPCTIEFISPVNGTILAPGTSEVLIKGKIKNGDSAPLKLLNNGQIVAFNNTTGEFQYKLKIDQANIFTSTTFEITDKKYIVNRERVSYAIGNSAVPGAPGVVDNAVRVMLTEDLLGQVVNAATSFMNTWKNDLIYGWEHPVYGSHSSESPFTGTPLLPIKTNVPDGMNGYIEINNTMGGNDKGYINIGKISMTSNIKPDRTILANMAVEAESWVNPKGGSSKALFVQGHYRTYPLGFETRIHFTLTANSVNVSNAKMILNVNSSNKIVATVDLSGASVSLSNPEIEFGFLTIPSWFVNFILDLVKEDIMSKLVMDAELVDINSLAGTVEGININGWPMNMDALYTATENDITMDIGLGAVIADPEAPVQIPGLNMFYSTPDTELPPVSVVGDENIVMALNDDLLNGIIFNALQVGLLKDLDISDAFKDLLKEVMPRDTIVCKLTITTPPVIDLSGNYSKILGVTDVGRVVARNVILELYNASIFAPKYPCVLRASGDLDAVLKLVIGTDGKSVQATIDTDYSKPAELTILYTNSTTAKIFPVIKDKIGVEITNQLKGVLEDMVNFTIPAIPVYNQSVEIKLNGTELANNSIIARARISAQ